MNWKTIVKIAVTFGLIYYLVSKLDVKTIYETFIETNALLLSLSLPLITLMYLIKARKWQVLLKCINVKIPIYESLKIVLIGTFYGVLTPGRAGEISRAFYLDAEKSRTIPTIIIDRVSDIICLLILSVLSIALFFYDINLIYLMSFVSILFTLGIIILTNEKILTFIFRIFPKKREHKENYIGTIREITKNKKTLFSIFSLGLGYYFANIIVYLIIIKSLNQALNGILAFSLPVIIILGNLPISISGLGVREFASVTIFSMLNESSTYGFSCSLILYFLTSLSPGLLGFLLTLKSEK